MAGTARVSTSAAIVTGAAMAGTDVAKGTMDAMSVARNVAATDARNVVGIAASPLAVIQVTDAE